MLSGVKVFGQSRTPVFFWKEPPSLSPSEMLLPSHHQILILGAHHEHLLSSRTLLFLFTKKTEVLFPV